MRQEEKYYDLIIKVNNHEHIDLSDDSSEGSIKPNYKGELDITEHRSRQLEAIVETTDEKPISMEEL